MAVIYGMLVQLVIMAHVLVWASEACLQHKKYHAIEKSFIVASCCLYEDLLFVLVFSCLLVNFFCPPEEGNRNTKILCILFLIPWDLLLFPVLPT